ncbi:MAG: winged helix-turn-helix transcriptional regulator [Rubrimonas sp.]
MENNTAAEPEICLDPNRCPVESTLSVIGGRWKPLILYHLRDRPRRFNELRRLMPKVTQRMLTQHLRELEADGVVIRDVRDQVPPHVEYSFSAKGRSLLPILDAMADWGRSNRREHANRAA